MPFGSAPEEGWGEPEIGLFGIAAVGVGWPFLAFEASGRNWLWPQSRLN